MPKKLIFKLYNENFIKNNNLTFQSALFKLVWFQLPFYVNNSGCLAKRELFSFKYTSVFTGSLSFTEHIICG